MLDLHAGDNDVPCREPLSRRISLAHTSRQELINTVRQPAYASRLVVPKQDMPILQIEQKVGSSALQADRQQRFAQIGRKCGPLVQQVKIRVRQGKKY